MHRATAIAYRPLPRETPTQVQRGRSQDDPAHRHPGPTGRENVQLAVLVNLNLLDRSSNSKMVESLQVSLQVGAAFSRRADGAAAVAVAVVWGARVFCF